MPPTLFRKNTALLLGIVLGCLLHTVGCTSTPRRWAVRPSSPHPSAPSAARKASPSRRSSPQPAQPSPSPPSFQKGWRQTGRASWYGGRWAGRKTASGERFNPRAYTAAHRKLPLGTEIEVRRPDNQRTVRVRINDRGPYSGKRILDLSKAAAAKLDMIRTGVAHVELQVLALP